MKFDEWYALIIPNGHIEFWKNEDIEFNKDALWEENDKKEFKSSIKDCKKYAEKYGLKYLFPNDEFEKEFNNQNNFQ